MAQEKLSLYGMETRCERVARQFDLTTQHLMHITQHSAKQLKNALHHHGATQIPSFVTSVPDGSETGVYLAVDLGGTHCRISSVQLHGDTTHTVVQAKHVVPANIRVNSSYEPVFDFVATKLKDFLHDHPELSIEPGTASPSTEGHCWRLGFTFSFTYESHSLSRGTMLAWDKGWDIPDALGKDPVIMLQSALDRQQLSISVNALTNDSVGTLMAQAYTSPIGTTPLMGTIFGSGTNASYIERIKNITKLHDRPEYSDASPEAYMILNTEWGAWFDDDTSSSIPSTTYDNVLDKASSNAGTQILEKRVSALYLAELARLVILQLIDEKELDMRLLADSPLQRPYEIDCSLLSALIDKEHADAQKAMQLISSHLGVDGVSPRDVQGVRTICAAIMRRAGRLAGAAIATIILHSEELDQHSSSSPSNPSSLSSTYKQTKGPNGPSPQDSLEAATNSHHASDKLSTLKNIVRRVMCGSKEPQNETGIPKRHGAPIASPSSNKGTALPQLRHRIDIGVDGSLFEHCPIFRDEIRSALRDIPQIGPEGNELITIGVAKDGSTLGAALVAQSVQ